MLGTMRVGVTFPVDDVEPATVAPPTTTLREHAVGTDVLAVGGDPGRRVLELADVDPLFGAVHCAFEEHRPLVLSPDAVWLTIARGVAHHVRLHAEHLRPRLVRHEGRKTLVVRIREAFQTEAAWIGAAIGCLRAALAEEIGAGPARVFVCDFSTTTDVDRVASEIVLLDVYSSYFDYSFACVCGIPSITLTGTPEDWRSIRARIDVVAELELEPWARSLRPILDRLVDASEGRADADFFRAIYKPQPQYGWDLATGWITRLYPYLSRNGVIDRPNPLLEYGLDEPIPGTVEHERWTGPGVSTRDVPLVLASATVEVDDAVRGEKFDLVLEGGVGAVAVSAEGELEPITTWTARRAVSLEVLISRMRRDAIIEPAREPNPPWDVPGSAELRQLYAKVGAATFPRVEARMRPWGGEDGISVGAPGVPRLTWVKPMIDLRDGSILGVCQRVWVRFPPGSIETRVLAAGADGEPSLLEHVSRLPTTELRAVRGSLGSICAQLLDGDDRLVDAGTLHEHLPPATRRHAAEEPLLAAQRRAKWAALRAAEGD